MKRKTILHFTLIAAIIGFMLAVQFQTTKRPIVRDTRDIWELRQDLKQEQELEQQLLLEIRRNDEKIQNYEQNHLADQQTALQETVDELKKEAGLTEIRGAGLILTIAPFYPENYVGPIAYTVSPELLKRFINELNMYDAKEIAIANERITNTTAIRDVNGVTQVGNAKISSLPIQVKVISDDVTTLYNRLKVSTIYDDFVIENLQLTVSEPMSAIVIPKYYREWQIRYMEAVKAEKEES
ncbi:DUF881 domain-containing protein [Anoxybacteroides tepidamans]|uniref:DUF881 domain-containing protein n=1 Tax=Anoxybacteroides tepidamans TaxID=265948 RepID=UPI001FE902F9|nr:DUF881 domain-containing protein [Anoxybacillus tepidamans]